MITPEGWELLESLVPGGWHDRPGVPGRSVKSLAEIGLVQVRLGPEGWSARLTRDGVDVLAHRAARDAADNPAPAPAGLRDVPVTPGEMGAVRLHADLTGGADSVLAPVVRDATHDPGRNRWRLRVDEGQATEVGRALWMETLCGSVRGQHRLGRASNIFYYPPSDRQQGAPPPSSS